MTDINDGREPTTEDNEEVIDLFADGADDLITQEQEPAEEGTSQEPAEVVSEEATAESSIPDKFKGKSAAEIAASYAELEKEFGRRGNELGDLRRITDDILKAQLAPKGTNDAEAASTVTSDDLLENPQAAIEAAVANSPALKKLEKAEAEASTASSLARFKETHADAEQVIQDSRFQTWVTKNPLRAKRWNEANDIYDFDVASEIIDTYKEVANVTQEAGKAERAAALGSVASPAAGAGNPGTAPKKKIFLKSELMKLKRTDPDRYERIQPQVIDAYLDKRVR